MKNTPIRIALGFAALLAASNVLAQESVDCFYEANKGHALCQLDKNVKSVLDTNLAKAYRASPAASEESVDCFYEANRWNAACALAPEQVALHH